MVSTRSRVEFAGIANSISKPNKRAIIARAMPVLPDVASINLVPDLISPRAMADSIMFLAARSLTEPPGLFPSSLPRMRTRGFVCNFVRSTSGVLPTKSNNAAILFFDYF